MGCLLIRLKPIARVRMMLAEMVLDCGLADLSYNERDILYAAAEAIKHPDDIIRTGHLQQTPLASQMSEPTFYRALGNLVQKGFLRQDSDCKRGEYRLNKPTA